MVYKNVLFVTTCPHWAFLLVAILIAIPLHLRAQEESPGQIGRTLAPTEALPPEFQSSGNMAILDRIPGEVGRIRSVNVGDTLRLLVFPKYRHWEFYRLGNSNRLEYYGKLNLYSSRLDAGPEISNRLHTATALCDSFWIFRKAICQKLLASHLPQRI